MSDETPSDAGECADGNDAANEIRRKIEALRLVLAPHVGRSSGRGAACPEGSLIERPLEEFQAEDPHVGDLRGDFDIEDSREVLSPDGKCLRIEKDAAGLRGMGHLKPEALICAFRRIAGGTGKRVIFLDLETTGLSATPLFLAGTLLAEGQRLVAVQLLARDYSEERCLISLLDGLLEQSDVCVTFNGKSFDLPYLRERAKYHRLGLRSSPEQLDLLHHARRRWKHRLPDCRLLTLEWHILGRRRFGDVEGWIVPCIYHEFVHTRNASRLKQVLRHNLMDVLSMAELLISLSEI